MNTMQKRPILAVDCDDVLNDLCPYWIDFYNKLYNDHLTIEDIKDWNIGKYTKIGDEMYVLLEEPKFFLNVPIQPDCYEVLKWANKHFNIQIVSATHPKTYEDKVNWVAKNLSFIPKTSFNCIYNKEFFRADILIDDKPENLKNFIGEKILFTKPWNKNKRGYNRVSNWKEIKYVLEQVLNGGKNESSRT